MISIIVCNQKGPHLETCFEGLSWQEGVEYEVVLVDYGMDQPLYDHAFDWFEQRDCNFSRLRVVRWDDQDPRWNHPRARNIGIAHARGDVLCLLNSDELMAPDLLASAKGILDDKPDAHVYWYRYELTRESTAALVPGSLFQSLPPSGSWGRKGTYGDFMLVRKALVVPLGGFDERCIGWGNYDTDLAARLNRLGHEEVWEHSFKLAHLWHPERPGIHEDWQRNVDACSPDWIAGRDVRNDGGATFDKYKIWEDS